MEGMSAQTALLLRANDGAEEGVRFSDISQKTLPPSELMRNRGRLDEGFLAMSRLISPAKDRWQRLESANCTIRFC